MKILYAFQGTGNGHVARARDLIPRFALHGEVDALIAGLESDIDLGFPIRYQLKGLAMVYDKSGAVSYWNSLLRNNLLRFIVDVIRLPVRNYDLVVIDFEAVTSFACLLKGVKSLQLSHQAAYLSQLSPRPRKRSIHWEMVLRYMSPSSFAIGFHFSAYDTFILPPIIRKEIRVLTPTIGDYYTVYLPSYSASYLVDFFKRFENERFQIFTKEDVDYHKYNTRVFKASVEEFKASLVHSKGLICGAGFEAPAEARYLGKKVLVCPIKGQYEQLCNGIASQDVGAFFVSTVDDSQRLIFHEFFNSSAAERMAWKDYADDLVRCIVNNAINRKPLDDISSLQVW
ncbi:MAG: hypothetical protein RLZZ599_249 [Bacteroidota bacterium]